eukprot:GFUD01108835.1.p1 GENE.GFUD01108835.1~~GFUD01108835.1.p1  ORF type:complete len:148 (-),score=35.98 GFUD01108835.1:30-473(-)
MTRQMLDRYLSQSMANQVFQPPLIAQRLLSCGIIATNCSLLNSGWVQCLATLVLDQLRSVFSINSLVVIDKMYKNLKKPKTLQELARNQIHKGLMLKPYQAMFKLNIPTQIKNYLLFHDLNVDLMITDYKDTIEHINDNGVSNVVHV